MQYLTGKPLSWSHFISVSCFFENNVYSLSFRCRVCTHKLKLIVFSDIVCTLRFLSSNLFSDRYVIKVIYYGLWINTFLSFLSSFLMYFDVQVHSGLGFFLVNCSLYLDHFLYWIISVH